MARVFNGSSQYLSGSSTLLSNEPIDMVVHANADTITAALCAVGLGDGASNAHYSLYMRGDVAGDPVEGQKRQTSSGRAASASYSATTQYVIGASFISDTSRAVFLDGTKSTNTTNITDPSPDFISIGALRINAIFDYFDGSLAESYILDVNMSDEDHAVVALGYSPIWSYPIGNVRGWYPLQTDNNNRMAGGYPDLAATGSPTDAIHPFNVVYPSINGVITM